MTPESDKGRAVHAERRLAVATELLRQFEGRFDKQKRTGGLSRTEGILLRRTELFLDEEFAAMGIFNRKEAYGEQANRGGLRLLQPVGGPSERLTDNR